ncbi:TetR/AcrR family transcriptional regulator [Blastococcus sp. CT_GayMR16]|uniref:TetR/AcrR family transcriptional regulator n=1 Tax=Blastococcus sp. CT_GayMR16 TaxID=2559607 RepID=UPI0010732F79|nr:TetR/AcrR family transcriptional regulator [Blastococcus sp. CT_GayMR16]TFV91137.1 TetR/AcrR family transcriptional regulator [Blastococcus sp. CT_GayMR16]
MPKLWTQTIEEHRRTVHDAILEAAWQLVAEHGLLAVTMSQIAEKAGIGRATLYKYFPDVEAILYASHQRHVAGHLHHLAELRDGGGDPAERLEAVLHAYAMIAYRREQHGTEEMGALLHRGDHVSRAQQQLVGLIEDVLREVAAAGELRDDVAPDELASYCLHALGAAGSLSSQAAVQRLVTVTLAGLHRQR